MYVKQAAEYERRPVTIGVSDYFFAEVQKGLSPGEVVSLEQPPKEKIKVPAASSTVHERGDQRRSNAGATLAAASAKRSTR